MDSEGAFEKVEQKSLNIQQTDDKKEWVFDANVVNGKSRIQVFKNGFCDGSGGSAQKR